MKLPASLPAIDKEKALQLLLAHGDKVVVGLLAILAAAIVWGGVDAIRLKSASSQRQPRTILDDASRAAGHIDRLQEPTAAVRVRPTPLAERVRPWQAPEIASVASAPLLDQPLFQELSRRTKPDVFPIERLTATAGLAVLSAAEAPGQGQQPESPRGRIVPFVVVTGLVPVAKQRAEYERRFSQTSYRDSKRDQPIWGEYLIERAEAKPGGGEANWQRIDLRAVAQKARTEWAGVQPESLPSELFMPGTRASEATGRGGDQPEAVSFSGYCLPLPKLASGVWGPETIHPTMFGAVREAWAKQPSGITPSPSGSDRGRGQPAEQQPDFGTTDADPRPAGEADAGGGAGGAGQAPTGKEPAESPFRLFRFIDTSVAPGRSYRYRVRVSVWNPNWKLDARHVDAAETAVPEKLASSACDPSQAAAVPEPTSVLVRSLSKADMKRFKSGVLEALVIGESVATGNYALRSMITEVGGLVNVDARLNKPGDTRARGEDIRTDRVIVDVRGRQNDRGEERSSGRVPLPPEPFELLVLKPDGSFEAASVADSQAVIDANAATLPAIESPARGPGGERGPRGDVGPVPGSPF